MASRHQEEISAGKFYEFQSQARFREVFRLHLRAKYWPRQQYGSLRCSAVCDEVHVRVLNPSQGAKEGKVRPVMVIQADLLTHAGHSTLLVVLLTIQRRHGTEALRVPIPARDRLLRDCYVMAEQLRAIDRARLGEGPLTSLTAAEITALDKALNSALGLV